MSHDAKFRDTTDLCRVPHYFKMIFSNGSMNKSL